MRNTIAEVLAWLGLGALIYGAFQISQAYGWITAGIILFALGGIYHQKEK